MIEINRCKRQTETSREKNDAICCSYFKLLRNSYCTITLWVTSEVASHSFLHVIILLSICLIDCNSLALMRLCRDIKMSMNESLINCPNRVQTEDYPLVRVGNGARRRRCLPTTGVLRDIDKIHCVMCLLTAYTGQDS